MQCSKGLGTGPLKTAAFSSNSTTGRGRSLPLQNPPSKSDRNISISTTGGFLCNVERLGGSLMFVATCKKGSGTFLEFSFWCKIWFSSQSLFCDNQWNDYPYQWTRITSKQGFVIMIILVDWLLGRSGLGKGTDWLDLLLGKAVWKKFQNSVPSKDHTDTSTDNLWNPCHWPVLQRWLLNYIFITSEIAGWKRPQDFCFIRCQWC